MELLEATGNGRLPWKKIVVNLIKACFKNIDLQYENYTTLRNRNKELIDNISGKNNLLNFCFACILLNIILI